MKLSKRSGKKWYLVNTQANQESVVEAHLVRQGFTVFLPSFLKTRRHARRVDQVRKALFPGYLFVEEPVEGLPIGKVNGTHGVRKLLMQGAEPAQVRDDLIQELKCRSDDGGVLDGPDLRPGAQVRFREGPLVDLVAVLHTLKDNDRLTVLFNFLGKEVKKTVFRNEIVPA